VTDTDTSFYKPNPANTAMTPLQVLQLVGAANQNKLFNQTYDARQAIGNAYKANVDPNGNVDQRGLIHDIAGTGGFLAGEGIGQAQGNVGTQFANQQNQQKYLQSTLGSLAALPNPTMRDINNWAVSVARNTNAPPEMIQSLVDGANAIGNDPKALKKYIATQGIFSLGNAALGGEAGPPTAGGAPTQISTGEAILRRGGVGPATTGLSGQSGVIAAPAAPNTGGGTGMQMAPAPGFQEAASQSGALMGNARAKAANFGADIYPLQQSLGALERLGPTGTGPGTDELNTVKSFLQSNLSWLPGVKIDPNSIKDFDEAKKYLTQAAGSRAAAFGHGTDQAMSTALTANPNTHISNLAAVDLTKATIGLRRMEQAQTLEADRSGVQPGQFSTWASRWATNVDPRAFMVDLMDQKQLQNLQKTLKNPKERARFNNSVQMAINNGIITRPGGEHNAGE
jgi:hypothetical protein